MEVFIIKEKITVNPQYCPKNHACPVAGRCPFGAIKQENPYSAPVIDYSICRNCGLCTRMCPVFSQA